MRSFFRLRRSPLFCSPRVLEGIGWNLLNHVSELWRAGSQYKQESLFPPFLLRLILWSFCSPVTTFIACIPRRYCSELLLLAYMGSAKIKKTLHQNGRDWSINLSLSIQLMAYQSHFKRFRLSPRAILDLYNPFSYFSFWSTAADTKAAGRETPCK